MAYIEIWEYLLRGKNFDSEIRKYIDEEEFVVRLPKILESNQNEQTTAIVLRFGLGRHEKHTYKKIGKELNVSAKVASERVRIGMLRLRHPTRLLRLRCDLTEVEKQTLHDIDNPWYAEISKAASEILPSLNIEKAKLFVVSATQIKYGKVLDPRDGHNISEFRYNIGLMNELRKYFGLEPLKKPERKLAIKQIDSMVDTLKSLGYKVIAPESETVSVKA